MASSDNSRLNVVHSPQLDPHHIVDNAFASSSQRKVSSSSAGSHQGMKWHVQPANRRQTAYSSSSRNTDETTRSRGETRASNKPPRSLPPWIDSYEEGDQRLAQFNPTDRLIPPSPIHAATHNHTPTGPDRRKSQDGFVDDFEDARLQPKKQETKIFGGKREPVKGRKWDHARDKAPVILQASTTPATGPEWRTYIKSSQYGPGISEDGKQVDEDFLRNLTPGYERPWRGDIEDEDDTEKYGSFFRNKKKQKSLMSRVQRNLLVSPYVPFVLRSIVFVTSILALGLSSSVHQMSTSFRFIQNPSTTMAIVVDVVALPYIGYITWDEYRGKPLGLRKPKTKIRLVLLDLFFIIFESANLALAFGALTDNDGACQSGPTTGTNGHVCRRIKTLCAILFVALLAWSLTFAVSIFRLVEKIGGREDSD